ncbi:DUF6817 domain-containing protein [Photobacterium sp. TY1-4]|uniref:DUF6817 domain-containing protein n=1 Tax=Photobacterium sp. TY1-4 TaxID=2899122 RepID=UPI0021C01847|nr:hypothetical protein [Photobacterium sp. TY1-4]UXI04339.1 hypothetical protein NH461_19820 [Photobacterium sp. TY1-4]
MDRQFEQLRALGAGDFQHLNGSLIAHLKETESILASWGADETLRVAGLYHAAYGTAGFQENMVSLTRRSEIAMIIGEAAEALVYLYCSCDRDSVFPQFSCSQDKPIVFKDRFTGTRFPLTDEQAKPFCELTVANELELVYASESFKQQYGAELFSLFEAMTPNLSDKATAAYRAALAEFAVPLQPD